MAELVYDLFLSFMCALLLVQVAIALVIAVIVSIKEDEDDAEDEKDIEDWWIDHGGEG